MTLNRNKAPDLDRYAVVVNEDHSRFILAALRLAKQWEAVEGLMTLNHDEQRFLEAFKRLPKKGLPR
jgi:hypothetical protein